MPHTEDVWSKHQRSLPALGPYDEPRSATCIMRKIESGPAGWPCTVGAVESHVSSSSSDKFALSKFPRLLLVEVTLISYVCMLFGSCLSGSEVNVRMVTIRNLVAVEDAKGRGRMLICPVSWYDSLAWVVQSRLMVRYSRIVGDSREADMACMKIRHTTPSLHMLSPPLHGHWHRMSVQVKQESNSLS